MSKMYKEEIFEYISSKPAYWFNDEIPTQIGQIKNGKLISLGRMKFTEKGWIGKYKPKSSKKEKTRWEKEHTKGR